MASKIEDYGFIGNLRTGALVSRSADIEWLCAPRFDSDACLASLVGYDEHGRWAMRPTQAVRSIEQRYRGDTLILDTDFTCEGGRIRVTDCMPIKDGGRCDVIRVLEGLDGEVNMEMLLDIRFGYGADTPWISQDSRGYHFTAGPDSMTLATPAVLERENGRVAAYPSIKKGQRLAFQLTWHPSHEAPPTSLDADRELEQTEIHWRKWASRCAYRGAYKEAVMRSLLTLKGLTYAPTGGIVAALTTSLPEALGGVRNWDYRFCWLRDASLTLDALMIGGYVDEAEAFRDWLLRATAGAPEDLQIMYDIAGGRRLKEFELDWLPGYESSRPVRVGNAASDQFQLDVYGEVLSCLYAGRKLGLARHEEGWTALRAVVEFLERAWQRPDDGIWEVRGGRRHFTHSKVMAWVAIDRVVKAIEEFGDGGAEGQRLLPHLRALRGRIHAEVCARGYNPHINSFTQYYGGDTLDASLLVIPHVGFLPASDPRVVGTVASVERTLLRDGFVQRYSTEHGTDGLPGDEGTFLACSFWLADNYALAGRLDEAERLFSKLLSLRNHLGLLAEEYDPALKRQLGNFPQAFSHLALIVTARVIDSMRAQKGAHTPMLDAAGGGNSPARQRSAAP
jgi:GH15 family glucan-1,4-alpha-glucosidase